MHSKILAPVVALAVAVLACAGCRTAAPTWEPRWSWERQHALVTEDGDLVWAPEPFQFEPGDSVRYIDYAGGDDANDGLTPQTPWKHHPWDPEAAGNAAEAAGAHTYVFKQGVVYRGVLVADESGTAEDPIRLTRDPTWGQGEAALYGSLEITGGWKQADPATAPGVPEPGKVWYRDVGTDFTPRAAWAVRDGAIQRLHLAREPDWEVTNPDDVKSNWYEWTGVEKETIQVDDDEQVKAWGSDPEHLTAGDADAYVGGTVWTEYAGVMGSPYANPIEAYDPERNAIRFAGPWGDAEARAPIQHCRYYLENLPRFLDKPGEYYYVSEGALAGRVYVRMPDEANPNESTVELARSLTQIDIRDQSHIHVTGLTFRFQNVAHWYDRWWTIAEVDPACVKALGSCTDIRVSNCTFEHVARAVYAKSVGEDAFMDRISVTDNEMVETDYGPIHISRGAELHRVEVLRNRLYRVGLRPMRAHHGHALVVQFASLAEIAGNVLDRCWGAGLFIFGGKGGGDRSIRPLSRVLIHHNKVTDPLLNTNDWGGIESWQGGPTYIYDNISGNPGGYWHWSHVLRGDTAEERSHGTARFGFAYYLDGAFKQYVFNNIAWGKSHDLTSPLCNTCGLQEIIGFMNAAFNNSFYNFGCGSRRQAPQHGRCLYLGNIWSQMGEFYFRHARPEESARDMNAADAEAAGDVGEPIEYGSLGYGNNVFHGSPRDFGVFEHWGRIHPTLESFRLALRALHPLAATVGVKTETSPFRDAENHDFRPRPGSPGLDKGVKFFVPWGLYGVVGEWHFYRRSAEPSVIFGENWFMTDEFVNRGMYRHIPRNNLTAHNVEVADYRKGPLEDWTPGALTFNGHDQYCVLSHEDLTADYSWGEGEERSYAGEDRLTVDMDTNNFLIEALVRTQPGHTGGVVVAKAADSGYLLRVDEEGRARLSLRVDGQEACARASSVPINDGDWHHVIAEVDRAEAGGITVYVDCEPADGEWTGTMPEPGVSLSNEGDFLVARSPDGDYFAGALDFLRVARGTLADAETTIEELSHWQFDGPFLKDFFGTRAVGPRDSGAIEYIPPMR
ncbi:MAG: LamG domain-containing protein [Candidatus Brocadiia bacterium]